MEVAGGVVGEGRHEGDEVVDVAVVDLTRPARLRQVLFNLLSNAAKFTQDGTISLEVTRAGGRIRFIVRDTGIGMNAGELDRIFDAFHQVDASATRQVGGTSLGLTISRHLCQLLGGDIEVASTPGLGSTLTIDLPGDPTPTPT